MNLYKADGVDVEAGDSFSDFAGKVCATTFNNSPFVRVTDMSKGHFRGLRAWDYQKLPTGWKNTGAADGIGTAVIPIDAVFAHSKSAQYLVAMCAGDLTRKGALPLVFFNALDTSTLGEEGSATNRAFRIMMKGLGQIAAEARLVLMGGETAELGVCVGSDNPKATTKSNWTGFCLGACHEDKMILGDELDVDQELIALYDIFRSNGWSGVRKAFTLKFGPDWYQNDEAIALLKEAVIPPMLYDNFLATANGWYTENFQPVIRAKAIAHVTGGSLRAKLGEDLLFPRGFSAVLNDLWDPPPIMKQVVQWRGCTDEQAYDIWNGGQGAIVAVDASDADRFVKMAESFGIPARRAGRILKDNKPSMLVNSKFNGDPILYTPKAAQV